MRVVVDAHMLGRRETGNETYVRELLRALASAGHTGITAAITPDTTADALPTAPGVDFVPLPSPGDVHRLTLGLRTICRQVQADVLHVSYNGPILAAAPLVVSVHDVSFRRFPSFYPLRLRLRFATLLRYTLHRADAVLAISEAARDDLLAEYPFLRGRIFVTPLAAAPEFAPPGLEIIDAVRRRHDLDRPYVLYVGTAAPRKNLDGLIAAWRRASDLLEDPPLLVWAGAAGPGERLPDGAPIIALGYVQDADLPGLYAGALALVQPSLHEGCSLPVLEAMACGTPVVASHRSALPEVVGDAGLLADSRDAEAFAGALVRIIRDAPLREELAGRSLERSEQRSWARTAALTWEVYRRAAGG